MFYYVWGCQVIWKSLLSSFFDVFRMKLVTFSLPLLHLICPTLLILIDSLSGIFTLQGTEGKEIYECSIDTEGLILSVEEWSGCLDLYWNCHGWIMNLVIKGWIVDLEVMKCVLICVTNRYYERTVGTDLTEGGSDGVNYLCKGQNAWWIYPMVEW